MKSEEGFEQVIGWGRLCARSRHDLKQVLRLLCEARGGSCVVGGGERVCRDPVDLPRRFLFDADAHLTVFERQSVMVFAVLQRRNGDNGKVTM
jgi:hypothetical protein